ncbi:MAG: hypothetical protein P3A28_06035 [Gemmatimonadota bacterium]|nr:hypothetical protein [Gemmatimonadota bacterium]
MRNENVVPDSGSYNRISEAERTRMLAAFDELVSQVPPRPAGDADAELAEIRRARRHGGRRTRAE